MDGAEVAGDELDGASHLPMTAPGDHAGQRAGDGDQGQREMLRPIGHSLATFHGVLCKGYTTSCLWLERSPWWP